MSIDTGQLGVAIRIMTFLTEGRLKSDVNDCMELLECVFRDGWSKSSACVLDVRDLKTIRSRVEHEGISFLTITLPSFAQAFERCLSDGKVGPASFHGWETMKGGRIPVFLQGIIGQVFDCKTGEILDENPQRYVGGGQEHLSPLIEFVRQLCLTFKKVEMECTPERTEAAFDNFLAIERSFDDFLCSEGDFSRFLEVSRLLWSDAFVDFDLRNIWPRHGPGATAERVSGNQKYHWQFWFDRLESDFPLVGSGYPVGIPENAEELQHITIVPQGHEFPVRVVQVPKTLKGPRIIAIEPACMQYAQQGIRDYLYDKLESYWLTKGHVNFRDQSINQALALKSSRTRRYATIDLKDASDRVPLTLALQMLSGNADLQHAVFACRSSYARLPDGREISPLRKFASMGSALCFPIEAMYFYTLCVKALLDGQSLSYTLENVLRVQKEVYVYGDDLVVPCEYADITLENLQKYNCKVNHNKSFVTGRFRESCGVDAYAGSDVTPVYVRQLRPKSERDSKALISWVDTANQLYKKGYWSTSSLMFNIVESFLGPLPYGDEKSRFLCRISFLRYPPLDINCPSIRWNSKLHHFEKKCWIVKPVRRTDKLEGYGALSMSLANLSLRSDDVFKNLEILAQEYWNFREETRRGSVYSELDLEHSVLHGTATLQCRWAPVKYGQRA